MGSNLQNLLFALLIIGASITAFVLLIVFVMVPLFRGIGTAIGFVFSAIGWFFSHIFEFIGGMLSDAVRFIGSLIAMAVLMVLVPLNIIIGRWSAAAHFAEGVKRECKVGSACVYRGLIRRPLKLLLLDGLLEGLEQRVPEAMQGAPGADQPSRRVGQFDGYTILGSLRAGGSGAKLYVAEPSTEKQRLFRKNVRGSQDTNLQRVVIKSFALTEGSSLPQIVRESRALECAKQMGLVLDHGMDNHRFFYVMPYHPGEHLGVLTRQMHGECGGRGLDQKRLDSVMSYMHDLLTTLSHYHKGGLWHKDVKPENVIVHDGCAHLVDLGLVTPLRSAMTLTTHGTEYFRDPEMVRQALRGVRVHQVDGAKFDIYAAGAVLYFMIENTFPAHGGLSRFAAKSPEALRWIVRRAMTDYNQRYSTVGEMLADLNHVMSTTDAFEVKPAELPSMRGASIETPPDSQEFAEEQWAGSAHPRAEADQDVDATHASQSAAAKMELKVTNWWTGEYRAVSSTAAAQEQAEATRMLRKEAFAFRDHAEHLKQQVQAGRMTARKAAREQIKAARQRAQELRARAQARRHRTVPGFRTPVSTVVIGALSVIFLMSIIVLSIFARGTSRSDRYANANLTSVSQKSGPVLLMALDSALPVTDAVRREIKKIVSEYKRNGYEVVEEPLPSTNQVIPWVREWRNKRSAEADRMIEEVLQQEQAYGLVHLTTQQRRNSSRVSVQSMLVRSSAPDAKSRRRTPETLIPAAPPMPYLLINDHPTKADLAIAAEIERRLKGYRDRGWMLVSNDDAETSVRYLLPAGPIDSQIPLPQTLFTTLSQANLGGIVRVDGKAGNEPPSHRVTISVIHGNECEIPPPASLIESAPMAPQMQWTAAGAGAVIGRAN